MEMENPSSLWPNSLQPSIPEFEESIPEGNLYFREFPRSIHQNSGLCLYKYKVYSSYPYKSTICNTLKTKFLLNKI
jgi:hypothetical protein